MSISSDTTWGLWTDYNRGYLDQWQILATDSWSQYMTSFVAVCLTLTSPYLFKISKSFLGWLIRVLRSLKTEWTNIELHDPSSSSGSSVETQRLLGQPPTIRRDESFANILSDSESSRDAVWKIARYIIRRGASIQASRTTFGIMLATLLFSLFVAQTVAGILSAKIASNKSALSSSTHCGIWQFDDNAGEEAAYRDDLYNYGKEARASQYARNCYNSPDPTDTLSCAFFYNQSIAFTTKSRQRCPFTADLCHGGLYSAVTFDTGLVDSSVIGINSQVTHKFRRKTSCSPLNMNESYVRGEFSADLNTTVYKYYYGPKENIDYTFKTTGDPFEWLVPVYSVNTYFSSLYPEYNYWQPLPKLMQPSNSTLTIIFVSSAHIYHLKPSFDPVFPATQARHVQGSHDSYYYKSDPRARAFACVDTSDLCSPDGRICWSMTASVPLDMPVGAAYWLMKWSMESSTIYDSIKWRLGSALLAQESVSQSVSNPLNPNQWEIEASQLFATSLARIQYDIWNIASGKDRERPGYIEVTPDDAKGHLCRLYKFRSTNWTNVNFLAFIGLPLAAIAIYILSLDTSSIAWNTSTSELESNSSKPLLVDVLTRSACNVVLQIIVSISRFSFRLSRKVWRYFMDKSTRKEPEAAH